MGWFQRRDERNQRKLERQNELMGGDDWAERADRSSGRPGEWINHYNMVRAALWCAALFVIVVIALARWIA